MASGGGVKKDTLTKGLARVSQRYPDVVAKALAAEVEIEATEVKRRTPVDTGALRNSVHTEGPFREGRRIYAQIVAGGPSIDYAIVVHEDPIPIHPVGQWKYIESVLVESRAYLLGRIAKRAQFSEVG